MLVFVLAGVAIGGYIYKRNRTGSIYHPHARFVPQPTPKLPARGPDRFAWPLYGYNKNHTRFFPAPASVRPPFRGLWVRNSHALLEFPPVIYGDHIFQLADNAVLVALDKHTGHVFWKRKLGALSASSPAVNASTVYATVLSSGNSSAPGTRVRAQLQDRPDALAPRHLEPQRVLPPARRRTRLLRLPERHRLRAQRAQRQRHLDLPRGRRREGKPDARATGCSTSATTPATCRRSPSGPGGGCG